MSELNQLFAVDAEELLLKGQVSEALELCKQGIEIYPDYPAAYSVLIKCFISLGRFHEAEQTITYSKDIFRGNKIFEKLSIELYDYQQSANVELPEDLQSTKNIEIPSDSINKPYSYYNHFSGIKAESGDTDEGYIDSAESLEEELITEEAEVISLLNEKAFVDSDDIQDELEFIDDEILADECDNKNSQYGFLNVIQNLQINNSYKPNVNVSKLDLIPGIDFQNLLNDSDPVKGKHFDFGLAIKGIDDISIFKSSSIKIDSILSPVKSMEEDEFSKLAIRLEGAKIGKSENLPEINITEGESAQGSDESITETIASIYEKQGAFEQAIDAYTILSELHPDRIEKYQAKISELEAKLSL